MIHIIKNKKNEFAVAIVADNGELLSMSEGLSSKQKAKQNIISMCGEFRFYGMMQISVQDDTLKAPRTLIYSALGGWSIDPTQGRTRNKYIPGKNPKRKSAAKKK